MEDINLARNLSPRYSDKEGGVHTVGREAETQEKQKEKSGLFVIPEWILKNRELVKLNRLLFESRRLSASKSALPLWPTVRIRLCTSPLRTPANGGRALCTALGHSGSMTTGEEVLSPDKERKDSQVSNQIESASIRRRHSSSAGTIEGGRVLSIDSRHRRRIAFTGDL